MWQLQSQATVPILPFDKPPVKESTLCAEAAPRVPVDLIMQLYSCAAVGSAQHSWQHQKLVLTWALYAGRDLVKFNT